MCHPSLGILISNLEAISSKNKKIQAGRWTLCKSRETRARALKINSVMHAGKMHYDDLEIIISNTIASSLGLRMRNLGDFFRRNVTMKTACKCAVRSTSLPGRQHQ